MEKERFGALFSTDGRKMVDNRFRNGYNKIRPIVEKGEIRMKKGEKRKQELLQIAYRMFLTRGYENTSVDEIIEEAGIAKGPYYY